MATERRYKIVLDVRGSQVGFKEHLGRGIGRFVTELAPRLPALMPDAEFTFIFDSRYKRGHIPVLPNVTEVHAGANVSLKGKQEILRGYLGLRPILEHIKPDIALFFCHEDSVLFFPRSAVIVYDLIPYRFPELYEINKGIKNILRTRLLAKLGKQAQLIFTISECSKRDIMEFWRVPPERIENIQAAIDISHFYRRGMSEIREARQRYSLPDEYLLYVGGIDPRKNAVTLLEALSLAVAQIPDIKLVMAGKLIGQEGYESVAENIRSLKLEYSLIMPGYIPDSDLPALYSGARAFVFPSLYEGFGLPLIEGLACGCPVIAGNNSAIPETAGEAAIYCDVTSPAKLAEAMEQVWQDEKLRENFLRIGPLRASTFSWDEVARKTALRLKRHLAEQA